MRADQEHKPPTGLRLRALLIGLPLCVVLAYITVYGDMVCKTVQIGILQLPPAAVGGLLVLIGLTHLLNVINRRRDDLLDGAA